MALTRQQEQVVNSSAKKIVVISCAGSGKTTVITQRIMRLCQEGVNPNNILALTFSSKAACEMRSRIRKENPNIGSKLSSNIKTFHAFGLEIIKKFSNSLGYSDRIQIIKGKEVSSILSDIAKSSGKHYPEGNALSDYIKNKKSFSDYTHIGAFDDVFELYSQYTKEKNLVDWDDMIWIPVNYLLSNENARKVITEQYRYIFVDEYQDTNEGQNRLLNLISDEDTNICLVGDDDQAIYEWRGAKPKYIRKKADSEEYELLKLETNFRSQSKIIQVANIVINNNKDRIPKTITACRNNGVVPLFTRHKDQDAEAKFVAERILELVKHEKYNASDIAVLVRNNSQIPPIIAALSKVGLSYDACEYDENSQYSQFLHVLHSIVKLESTNDLSDALNFPERCFDKFIFTDAKNAYCDIYGQDCNFSTMEWIDRIYLSNIEFENSDAFRERYALITQLHSATNWKPSQVISLFINYLQSKGYDSTYPDKYHFTLQVYEIAKSYEESFDNCTLSSFIEHLELTIGEYGVAPNISLDSVNLLTMHKSKGLEFKVVFIVGVQVGVIPNDFFINSIHDLETERRLFYVAITRAKDLLFISSFRDPFGSSCTSPFVHHGFMAEIPKVSYSSNYDFSALLHTLPRKDSNNQTKSTIGFVSDAIQQTIESINPDNIEPVRASEPTLSKQDYSLSLKDLSEGQVDLFFEQSLALSHNIILPDDKFIVIIGHSELKTKVIKALLKINSIINYEIYDYEGTGFNINRLENNYKCAGIILGPQAHKLQGVDATSLKGKILSSPEAFPFMVDLVDRHITKTSLQEAIVKIKWNYSRSVGD